MILIEAENILCRKTKLQVKRDDATRRSPNDEVEILTNTAIDFLFNVREERSRENSFYATTVDCEYSFRNVDKVYLLSKVPSSMI